MKERIIFHIDVNNAFLSWTALDLLNKGYKKDIRLIPSVIGGDEKSRRGIVLAKSMEAKKYGIVTAETLYSARNKCKRLETYPPNYYYYYEKSKELMEYLSEFSPNQEQISVDECFLDMSGMDYIYKDIVQLAYQIKDEVKEKFGYTVNIGVANNKLCAKMASDFEKPDKVHTLLSDEIEDKLWPLDVKDLYMCGKRTTAELYKLNIKTIGDLAKCDEKFLERHFKSQGKYLKNAALGIDDSKVEVKEAKHQSISTTETLPYDFTDREKLKNVIFQQTEELARELRSKKLYVKTIGVVFKNNKFISYSAQTTLDNPTDNTKEILKAAYEVFDNNYRDDEIRLIGVRLANLTKERSEQIDLFSINDIEKDTKDSIQKTIDEINNKFGKSLVKPASLKVIGEYRSKKGTDKKEK